MFSKVIIVALAALQLSGSVLSAPQPVDLTVRQMHHHHHGQGGQQGGQPGGQQGNQQQGNSSQSNQNQNNNNNNNNPQTSLTLLQSVIATGFEQNGQATQEPGQVASLTSSNNFINFCATVSEPLTNGQQIKTGSCNPAPMGQIAATTNMPTAKFNNPVNFGKVPANQNFTISMGIKNLKTGNFVNADTNYYSAPQQIDQGSNNIVGHSHFTIQAVSSFTSTDILDANTFAFFKGINTPADGNGNVNTVVAGGLPKGFYRLSSINTAANHQPCLVAVAQHGSLDDTIYFQAD